MKILGQVYMNGNVSNCACTSFGIKRTGTMLLMGVPSPNAFHLLSPHH